MSHTVIDNFLVLPFNVKNALGNQYSGACFQKLRDQYQIDFVTEEAFGSTEYWLIDQPNKLFEVGTLKNVRVTESGIVGSVHLTRQLMGPVKLLELLQKGHLTIRPLIHKARAGYFEIPVLRIIPTSSDSFSRLTAPNLRCFLSVQKPEQDWSEDLFQDLSEQVPEARSLLARRPALTRDDLVVCIEWLNSEKDPKYEDLRLFLTASLAGLDYHQADVILIEP